MATVRRSQRTTRKVDYAALEELHSYPDGPAITDWERHSQKLNKGLSYPTIKYAEVDDHIIKSLFSSKSKPDHYRAHLPAPTEDSYSVQLHLSSLGLNMKVCDFIA